MLRSIHEHIRKFASYVPIEAAEKVPIKKDPAKGALSLHAVKISFSAPPTSSTETLTIDKNKAFEANFQWMKYSLSLSDKTKTIWLSYITGLDAWGTRQKGTEEVVATNDRGILQKGDPVDFTSQQIEKMFPKLLGEKPNLEPDLPEGMITYINAHKKDKGKEYTPGEFRKKFEETLTENGTNFYILISKSNELKTPFGKVVGKKPEKAPAKTPPAVPKGPAPVPPAPGAPKGLGPVPQTPIKTSAMEKAKIVLRRTYDKSLQECRTIRC